MKAEGEVVSEEERHSVVDGAYALAELIRSDELELTVSMGDLRKNKEKLTLLKSLYTADGGGGGERKEEEEQLCAICLDSMNKQQELVVLACAHSFHSTCYNEMTKRSAMGNACPKCKQQTRKADVIQTAAMGSEKEEEAKEAAKKATEKVEKERDKENEGVKGDSLSSKVISIVKTVLKIQEKNE